MDTNSNVTKFLQKFIMYFVYTENLNKFFCKFDCISAKKPVPANQGRYLYRSNKKIVENQKYINF